MKFKTLTIAVGIALFSTQAAQSVMAEPRIEEECHFVYDQNDANNEIKVPNCNNPLIHTFTEAAGNEVASASITHRLWIRFEDGLGTGLQNIKLKGDGIVSPTFNNYLVQANSDCVLVTKNYNNGQYNFTEYRTRDWNATVTRVDYEPLPIARLQVEVHLACRNGAVQN